MDDAIVLGVDIGGSHITAGLVNMHTRTILDDSIRRQKVNSGGSTEEIIQAWSSLIKEATGGSHDIRVGIAMPGPFDYEQGISYIKGLTKYESLFGKNVKSLLADALGIPMNHIRLKNDAGCFLQGETFAGTARGYASAIGLTLGTGLGTATAKNGIADDADRWKTPMRGDIAENFISTRWFVKRYTEVTGKEVRDVKHLCELLDTNPELQSIFDEFAESLAEFLKIFIMAENPEVIVIGGNISNVAHLFVPAVKQHLINASLNIPIKKSNLGEHAVLLGSAALWNE
jgi:glucokinase